MNIEEIIKNCEISSKQIKQYEPDPFYVNHFLNEYINSVNDLFNGIFEEASKDFGFYIKDKITHKRFDKEAKNRKDKNAKKFSEWYSEKFYQEHDNTYPSFIKKICQYKNQFQKLPKIEIMIRAKDRYKDDVNQKIKVNLSQKKISSKEELEIEINRQLPIFLEIINHKRIKNNEPKVREKQIVASTFLDIDEFQQIEIMYATELYLSVMKRLVHESREKIKEFTTL